MINIIIEMFSKKLWFKAIISKNYYGTAKMIFQWNFYIHNYM